MSAGTGGCPAVADTVRRLVVVELFVTYEQYMALRRCRIRQYDIYELARATLLLPFAVCHRAIVLLESNLGMSELEQMLSDVKDRTKVSKWM